MSLNEFIAEKSDDLLRILKHFVLRGGLAYGTDADAIAAELLSELVVVALKSQHNLKNPENPMPWFIGIAINLIKRKRSDGIRLNQREPLLHDLYPFESLSEDEVIDRFVGIAHQASTTLENSQVLNDILAGVSSDDAHILRLAVIYELDGVALGRELNITPGAARVRLHRALKRLRAFWGTIERINQHD